MGRRAAWALLVALGACATPEAPTDAGLDTSAELDAFSFDAGRSLVDPRRPPGYRTLHPTCGMPEYDLDDGATYDTPEELGIAISAARCEHDVRCGLYGAGSCDPTQLYAFWRLHTPVDVAAAEACLRAVRDAECADGASGAAEAAACAVLERGFAPGGAPCASDSVCASRVCEHPDADCGGRCAAYVPCPPCAAGETCDGGVCTPLPGVGEPCETTLGTGTCAPGLTCTAGICTPLPGPGEACVVSFPGGPGGCTDGATCVTSTCVANPGDGEACLVLDLFGFPYAICAAGTTCVADVCVTIEVVADGEACDLAHTCAPGSDCVEGTCARRPGNGEACRSDGACADGLWCNQWGTCGSLVMPGCACDDTVACPHHFVCASGLCTFLGAAAVPCSVGCQGYACVDGFCHVGTINDPCEDDSGCAEGICRPLSFGRCQSYRGAGGDCEHHPYGCGSGLSCERGVCEWPEGSFDACYDAP